jgi:ATP-binding cassette subfamily C protein CydC
LDLLEHLDVLKAYGWLSVRAEQLSETDKILQTIAKKKSLSIGVGQSLFSFFATAATIATAFFGAVSVANQEQPGVLLALFALIPMAIFDVLLNAQPALSSWRAYKASATRILELQDKKIPKILVPTFGETDIAKFKELSLSRVSLGYPDQAPVLKDLSFELKAGETLLLKGISGSGKSTIALALLRFLDLQSGAYVVNGRPIADYSVDSVRRTFGLVEQQPTIFMGSVRDNLLIANLRATDEDLNQVLVRVGLSETFDNRDGLETNLGERGVLISGGEAQRLALARALLANFDVLILDEPTANVDEERAHELIEDLLSAARQDERRAIILITHDESLGKLADRVIRI